LSDEDVPLQGLLTVCAKQVFPKKPIPAGLDRAMDSRWNRNSRSSA